MARWAAGSTGSRRRGGVRDVLRDPVLLAMAALALLAVPAFLLGPIGLGTSWTLQTLLDGTIVGFAARLAALSTGQRFSRRFWRSMSVAGALCAAGDGYQTVLVLLHDPGGTATSLVQPGLVIIAMCVMVVTMLRHPLGSTGRQRLRLLLDAVTVLVAVAVFLWYFSLAAQLQSVRLVDRYAAGATSVVMLVIVFGVLKLILSGTAPFTKVAGVAGSVGVAGTALSTSIGIILTGGSHPRVILVIQLLPCILTSASLRLQEVLQRHRVVRVERRRRRFSRMPYVAVIATQVLMVVAVLSTGPDERVWGVAVGVVVITGLVLGRQLAAFQDNDRLLTSLDESMLELRSQKEWFSSLVQHASDVTVVVDGQGDVAYASPAVARVLGTTPQDAVGVVLHERVHPADLPRFVELRERLAADPGSDASARVRLRHTDGTYRWLDIVGVDLRDNQSVRGFVFNARDVTDAHELQEALQHRATHDVLTGLANRALLGERLRAAAGTGVTSILVIDLDGFKQVNDLHGHHTGDELLVAVAGRLIRCADTGAPGSTVARLGGDEFAVLLPGAPAGPARRLAADIGAALSEPVVVGGERLGIGASVGTATGAPDDLDALLRDADAAMYAAKKDRKAAVTA